MIMDRPEGRARALLQETWEQRVYSSAALPLILFLPHVSIPVSTYSVPPLSFLNFHMGAPKCLSSRKFLHGHDG
jgi:hypothetical protein